MKKWILFVVLVLTFCGCVSRKPSMPQLAIWDFDGTIIKGDCSEGLTCDGRTIYDGIAKKAILAGFSRQYRGEGGANIFFSKILFRPRTGPKTGGL